MPNAVAPRVIDLRSDTLTKPTDAMRRAMAEAEVGDDVYGEDPTVNRLEATAARLMGKEAGLFVTSGTMGNFVSALSWCDRGDELLCGADAHLLVNEMGAAGLVALETMVDRLADDHANAKRLAEGLAAIPGFSVDPASIETNIVYAELDDGDGPGTAARLRERGVLANGRFNWVRFVPHYGVTAEDIDEALDAVEHAAKAGAR